jgi:S-adenosyl-L-methionine hydrolase (adenosine-forming)
LNTDKKAAPRAGPRPVITLLTDFGLEDSCAAALKGVILCLAPGVTIVDITHYVPSFNILSGAYLLKTACPYFPSGSIHVAVVDPGVGSERNPIIVQTPGAFFVGPDNGIFTYVVKTERISGIFRLENPAYRAREVSSTFHGRDIFAPVAAHLFNGVPPAEMGPELDAIVELDRAFPKIMDNKIHGAVIHVDSFGNLVTNVTSEHISTMRPVTVCTQVAHCSIIGLRQAYHQGVRDELITYIGSGGHLEIGCNGGSAAEKLNAGLGADVVVRRQ